MFKICPSCGGKNPESAIICSNCIEDISSVTPQEENNENKPTALVIFEGKEYKIESPCIIGRNEFLKEILSEYKTISRKHLKIYFEEGSWFIEDLNSTNGTFLNGEPIKNKHILKNEDVIGLGQTHKLIFILNKPI